MKYTIRLPRQMYFSLCEAHRKVSPFRLSFPVQLHNVLFNNGPTNDKFTNRFYIIEKNLCESMICTKNIVVNTMWLVRLFVCCAFFGLSYGQEEVVLDIPQGSLKGLKTTTAYHGMPMYSFKGIPYAKPNIGPNKFRMSEPADGWTGVRDATKLGDTCVFFCMVRSGIFGSEDCLFVNVYTPDLNNNARRAVMVFIHGGGFNAGSGDDDLFGADYLVEKDVVVVTFNYRIGAVGFLNTGDASAPGNAGLKDQVLALKWVQDNIVNFGGCPMRVTIFGQSAGSAAVQYHMLSPMSQGLFKNAIMQSGSVASSWSISYTPKEDAMQLADKFGIKATSTADLVQKLTEIPTKDLVIASGEISKTKNILNGEMHLFAPAVEANVGQEMFLPADPWEILKSGKIADVPLMVGLNTHEAGFLTPMLLPMAPNFADHFELFIPKDLNLTDPAMRKMMGDSLKKFYFNGKPLGADTAMEFTDLLTDVIFTYGSALTTAIMNSRNSAPVYEYYFSFHAPFGFMKALFKMEDGVIHGDELTYEFYSNAFKYKPAPGSPEEQKTNEIIEMWTNFAKEGNPSATMDVAKVKWEPMGTDQSYLEIGKDLTMKKSLWKERVNLWAGFYKDILGDYAKLFN